MAALLEVRDQLVLVHVLGDLPAEHLQMFRDELAMFHNVPKFLSHFQCTVGCVKSILNQLLGAMSIELTRLPPRS